MKRIISERFVTYAANEKWPSTARITIKMCDAIDQAMMQDALAATQQRYPYFCVRFRITNGDDGREYFALEDNPQPWVMQQTSKPVCLMGRESNDHLLAFACWDDCFAIDFFHGLSVHLVPELPNNGPGPKRPYVRLPRYFWAVLTFILIIALAVAVRMIQRWQHIEEARKEAEAARAEAELSNLRNQMNPHFLLNTLNNIYALIAFDQEKAQMAVGELSKLLRHVLYENQQDFVPLYKEVDFMQNYIELMKIRVTDSVKIDTNIDILPNDSTPVAPLIFISLIENAFKHGISPQGKGEIKIGLHQVNGDITCEICNTCYPKRENDKSGSGIGLEQVSRRLELLYPDRYVWEKGKTEDGSQYYSKIIIKTEES